MPLRSFNYDPGFTLYPVVSKTPTEQLPAANPGDVLSLITAASPLNPGGLIRIAQDPASLQRGAETLFAGLRQENDILNAVQLLTRPQYTPDPTFDLPGQLKKDGLWNDYSDNFIGVQSKAEYDDIVGRIKQEEEDKATLARAGFAGQIAAAAAGIVSPTSLLPFIPELRGAKAVAAGAALGFVGGAAQEIPLQLQQETRTAQDSFNSVAFSTVVGGILGGAVAFANRPVAEIAQSMADTPGVLPISTPRFASAGAAAAEQDAGRLAPIPVLSALGDVRVPESFQGLPVVGSLAGRRIADLSPVDLVKMSPVTRGINGPLAQGRRMMARLADAGLQLEGNIKGIASNIGGTVENRIRTYYGPVAESFRFLDDQYSKYWLGADTATNFVSKARADLAGLSPNRVKLNRQEFEHEVARALNNGDVHDIPEVQAVAQELRRRIYDPILQKAQEAGLLRGLKPDGPVGDTTYLNRLYDTELIRARQDEFETILATHYNQKLVDQFRADLNKLQERAQRETQAVADYQRPPEEVAALREQFLQRLKALDEGRDENLAGLELAIADKRAAARSASGAERTKLLQEARTLEDQGGAPLAGIKEERATIRRRLSNLNRAVSSLQERQLKKLDKIERSEELSVNSLRRVVLRGQKLLRDMDKLSDTALDEELSKLKNRFEETAQRYDRGEERISKLLQSESEDPGIGGRLAREEFAQIDRTGKLTDIANAIGDAEGLDRQAAREVVQETLDAALEKVQGIISRRAVRAARLAEQASNLDPAITEARIREIQGGVDPATGEKQLGSLRQREQDFLEKWRQGGADNIDLGTGVADFARYARDLANQSTNKILGTYARLPGFDTILQQKGAELARTLDIPSNLLVSGVDGRSFLNENIKDLVMAYVRTMAPDIELQRALGDFAPDSQLNNEFKLLVEEGQARKAKALEDARAGRNPETGRAIRKPYTQQEIDQIGQRYDRELQLTLRDLQGVIARLRHTRGIPTDPRALGARAAEVAADINTLRFMNMVTVSSLPDIAGPILKYGLQRTFKDGWVPFVKGLGGGEFTRPQLRSAGAALDMYLHSRLGHLADINDYLVRGSKFEKGLSQLSSRVGLVGLFDQWTTAMKQIAGSTANAQIMDYLSLLSGGQKGTQKELKEATTFLAANGIDGQLADVIWREVQKPGGSETVNGVLWPNTDAWSDEARMAYNAMLVREVERTIVTPGAERPLIVDSSPIARLLWQFKSFALASSQKVVLAGLQQADMAVVNGVLISLAAGAASYYIAARLTGGTTEERMNSAIAKGDWGKFADEAINRSGMLGIGSELQSTFAAVPLTAPYVTFSGERVSRRSGEDIYQQLAGPTFGDLLSTVLNVASGADSPTQGTIHQTRRLLPFQNHFALRRLFDQVEAAAASHFPERRQ